MAEGTAGAPPEPPASVSAAVAEHPSTNAEPPPQNTSEQQNATPGQPDAKADGGEDGQNEAGSQVSEEQWKAMSTVIMAIYEYRAEE